MRIGRPNFYSASASRKSLESRAAAPLLAAGMRRQLSLILTLSAWLLATGSPWDLVQTFGWGRMIATYSQSMPLLQAVKKTFSGEALCGVCELVQSATQRQDAAGAKVAGTKAPEKIFFVSAPRALVFASPAPMCAGLVPDVSAPSSAERPAPPLPPPRSAA
jgi:hypothetical protein